MKTMTHSTLENLNNSQPEPEKKKVPLVKHSILENIKNSPPEKKKQFLAKQMSLPLHLVSSYSPDKGSVSKSNTYEIASTNKDDELEDTNDITNINPNIDWSMSKVESPKQEKPFQERAKRQSLVSS